MSPSRAQFFLGINELPEVRLEFSFILIERSTMAFITNQSWCVIKSWCTGGVPRTRISTLSADGLNQSLVSSVAQANRVGCRRRRGKFDKHQTYLKYQATASRSPMCAYYESIMDPFASSPRKREKITPSSSRWITFPWVVIIRGPVPRKMFKFTPG